VRRSIQTILILSLLCGLGGCLGPDYGPTYGYPTHGYSPYSYGLPVYAGGYAPAFAVRHPWEEHHGEGHHQSFFRGPAVAPHFAGGFSGHGGGGHR
jgi:hypothetical protein